MIVDLDTATWPPDFEEPDIAMVGAGAAGLALARSLISTRLRILVLESGGTHVTKFEEGAAIVSGFGARTFRDGRGTGFGGTTAMWAGQVLPFEPIDFEQRPWVPDSGWPLQFDDLEPFYRRAERLLGLPAPPHPAEHRGFGLIKPLLTHGDLDLRQSQFAPEPDMAVLYREQLARAPNVAVLLHAPVSRVRRRRDTGAVESVEVVLPNNRRRTVPTATVVVGCGAVESSRLLLASLADDERWPAARLMGRYFQDHAHVALPLRPAAPATVARALNSRLLNGRRVLVKLIATRQLQTREGLLHVGSDLCHVASPESPLHAARVLAQAVREPASRRDAPAALRSLVRQPRAVGRALGGRLRHGYKVSESDGAMRVVIQAETAPNPDSRVALAKETDALGRRRAHVRWSVGELERRSMQTYARILRLEFAQAGLGEIDDRLPPLDDDAEWMARVNAGHHHLGTLRMGIGEGVVDANCQVHGAPGLYVAGGAVFPTSGFGNPTLTILALTLRLADHLRSMSSLR